MDLLLTNTLITLEYSQMAVTENPPSLASIVKKTAPEECPDRQRIAKSIADPRWMKYQAYLVKRGKAECLGEDCQTCNNCSLRVASYTVRIKGSHPPGLYRFPTEAVQFNPAPSAPTSE